MGYLDQPTLYQRIFTTPIRPDPPTIKKRLELFFGFFILQQIIALIFVKGLILTKTTHGYVGMNLQTKNDPINDFLSYFLIMLVVVWSFRTIHSFNSIAKGTQRPFKIRFVVFSLLWTFGIYILYLGLTTPFLHQITTSTNQKTLESFYQTPISLIFIIIDAVYIAPHFEEFMFRYLIINNRHWLGLKIIMSALLFGLAHMLDQAFTIHNQQTMINFLFAWGSYTMLGLGFAHSYVHYNDYRVNTGTHGTYNALVLFISLLIK